MPATLERTKHTEERNGYRLSVDSQETYGVREWGWWIYKIDKWGIPTTVAHCCETWGDFDSAYAAGKPEFQKHAGE